MTPAEYRAHPGVNKSALDAVRKAPEYYAYWRDHGREETDALRLGNAFHTAVLEPETWADRYLVRPQCDRRLKAHKRGECGCAEFEQRINGRTEISEEEHAQTLAMAAAVWRHPGARKLLGQGGWRVEEPVFWERDGRACKARPDLDNGQWIVDLKRARDASPVGFAWATKRYRYDVQAYWYSDGVERVSGHRRGFAFIAVEPDASHLVGLYAATTELLERGRQLAEEDFRRLLDCEQRDRWPGYHPGMQELYPI